MMSDLPSEIRHSSPVAELPEARFTRAAFIAVRPWAALELARLETLCLDVRSFDDGDEFLVSPNAYEHDLFVIGDQAPMPESLRLLRLLNLRTNAPILAWKTRAPCATWLDAGADMWLPRSASVDDFVAAIRALERRIPLQGCTRPAPDLTWHLRLDARMLHAPGGQMITLSETDSLVLERFANAGGKVVAYGELAVHLGHPQPDPDNWLRAVVYRLRRRIEQATGEAAPIDAQARKGYVFRGRLQKEL